MSLVHNFEGEALREVGKATHISPSVVLLIQIKPLRILAARRVGAVLARRRRIRILHIPSIGPEKIGHVLATGLAQGRAERGELVGLALHLDVPEQGAKEAADKICEWVEVVEPVLPEGGHGRVGCDDAAEGDEAAAEEQRVGDGREVLVRRVRCDGLAHGRVEEFVD